MLLRHAKPCEGGSHSGDESGLSSIAPSGHARLGIDEGDFGEQMSEEMVRKVRESDRREQSIARAEEAEDPAWRCEVGKAAAIADERYLDAGCAHATQLMHDELCGRAVLRCHCSGGIVIGEHMPRRLRLGTTPPILRALLTYLVGRCVCSSSRPNTSRVTCARCLSQLSAFACIGLDSGCALLGHAGKRKYNTLTTAGDHVERLTYDELVAI